MIPVKNYKVTCPYGKKGSWQCGFHCGVDLVPADYKDFNIYAPVNALVWQVGRNHKYYGNYIILKHNDGYFSRYAHLQETKVLAGKQVQEGEILGIMGATGRAFGRHLHWEVNKGERMSYPANTNPLEYIKGVGKVYSVIRGIHQVKIPVENFKIVVWDKPKKTSRIRNYANAGFFANATGNGQRFTLPIGHLVADVDKSTDICKTFLSYRGRIEQGKCHIDAFYSPESFRLKDRPISSLVVTGNKAEICKIKTLEERPGASYIVSGIPVMKDGRDVSWKRDVTAEGWSASSCYATKHIFLGLKQNDNNIYLLGITTNSRNCIQSSEIYHKLKPLGFTDVIKLDGGGSCCVDVGGRNRFYTRENRRVNNLIMW